ncbi:MAG: HDIG domain-containing protein [Phycisphaerae bacterium]|nr:HDIG domain-containing protein [Phycisphaerae bacterium]
MFFKKKNRQRREMRKSDPSGPGRRQRVRDAGGVGSVLRAIGLFVAALIMEACPREPVPYRVDGHLSEDVYARVEFQFAGAQRPTTMPATQSVEQNIPKGRLLVTGTADGGLKEAQVAILSVEHDAFLRQRSIDSPMRRFWILLGRAGIIAGVVALLGLYVAKYSPRIVKNHWRGLAIVMLILLVLLLSRVVVGAGRMNPYLSVFGIFVAAAMLAIAYDQRFAFAVTGALVILTALQIRLGVGGLLVLWSAAAAIVFQLHEVRTRSKLIETGGVVAVVVFLTVWLVESAADMPGRFVLVDGCYAAGAAIAGGFLTQGILPLIERVFGVATSLTLLEWCDANKPLLKRLALEAPGTYNHSLVLGAMCESAAEAIGARGLLARVGAYYHDAGKINKPDYFVENQAGSASRHEKLSPAMSLLVIKGHVKDGVEMARQYGLPRILREFIATHHGTTLVEYFYHAAAEQRADNGESAPDEVEFRYPGPKPRMKEAAILMLADASESSVRATQEPTAGRIETQVHFVISKRLMDGQLDECELTLREVHAIETSLVKSLCGMYHVRLKYPSQEKPKTNGEEEKPPNGLS